MTSTKKKNKINKNLDKMTVGGGSEELAYEGKLSTTRTYIQQINQHEPPFSLSFPT